MAHAVQALHSRRVGPSAVAVYDVRVLPVEHQLRISLHFDPPLHAREVDLDLPSWVPGSYWFRTLGRNISEVAAFDAATGLPLAVRRRGWQGYRIEGVAGPVCATWRVAAYDVENSQLLGIVTENFAVLSAANFFRPSSWRGPCRVVCKLPAGWRIHLTGPARLLDAHAWQYPNYSLILDSPAVLGNFTALSRDVDGARFHFVFLDRALGFESGAEDFVDRVAATARECRNVFGSFPFPSYSFILTANPDLRWGLEHLTSSVCSVGPDVFIDPEFGARAVRTCAHELFHAWNVRRLRPWPFGRPFDLERGSFTEGLWLSEGFTRYYEFLLCVRAGIYRAEEFFSNVVNNSEQLCRRPAYGAVTAADSSLATFLNHRKYPNDVNTSIDYYQKGMLMAFDLDAELRLSGDSLDAALRDFYAAFAGRGPGYTTAQALDFFLRRNPAAGRRLARAALCPGGLDTWRQLERLGFEYALKPAGVLGLALKESEPVVAHVFDGSPAGMSGLAPGDRLLGIGGFRFSRKALRWAAGRPQPVTLDVTRGHRLRSYTLRPAQRAAIDSLRWSGTEADARRIREWLRVPNFEPQNGAAVDLSFYENFHGADELY